VLLNQLLKDKILILASKSPRRQQLLRELGVPFDVRLFGETDESYPNELNFSEIPEYLATKKALPYIQTLASHEVLITSDTIVWCKGKVLGKPTNREDAVQILKDLSGCMHTVITGIALRSEEREHTFSVSTDVYFKELSDEEIYYYIDNYSPYDKAGAYGIQEWIGYVGVERIDGSYFNVMGLPVQKLYTELISFLQND
jgi:septum formation protein